MKFIKEHKGVSMFITGIVFNFLESLYFEIGTEIGFNLKPLSIGEYACDIISAVLIVVGMYLMCLNIAKRLEVLIKK